MRLLIAPDKFAGTLTAVEAAEAIATGWRRHAPSVEVDLAPMADGGPGFVEVLRTSLGGRTVDVEVRGPLGAPAQGQVLVVDDVAYVESAQACGLHLAQQREPRRTSTYGVGELVRAAVAQDVRRVVLGAGGSGTTDGGAGMLAALGATADVPLGAGPDALAGVQHVDLAPAREALGGVALELASDVDNPLTGLFGAAKVYGPQKGLSEQDVPAVDAVLEQFAHACDRRTSLEPGAGAAGGLGFAALLLGAARRPGLDVVAEALDLAGRMRAADLVVTGEGAFDFSSRSGKVPYGVAQWASEALRPCITLAGQVLVGAREMRALGMDGAYSVVDAVGEERAFAEPAAALAELAERVARSWTVGE